MARPSCPAARQICVRQLRGEILRVNRASARRFASMHRKQRFGPAARFPVLAPGTQILSSPTSLCRLVPSLLHAANTPHHLISGEFHHEQVDHSGRPMLFGGHDAVELPIRPPGLPLVRPISPPCVHAVPEIDAADPRWPIATAHSVGRSRLDSAVCAAVSDRIP